MEKFPHPLPPTEAQIKIEEQQIRCILFGLPRFLTLSLMAIVIVTAIAVACNFNVMQWME